jgi:hypothetical protein
MEHVTGADKANFQLQKHACIYLTLVEASAETGSVATAVTSSNAHQTADRKSI